MSVKLTIEVDNISSTLAAGYTHIKLYRSPSETSGFSEITTPSTKIPLQAGVSEYEFIDYNGNPELWYRTTYYDENTPAESAYGDSSKGEYIDTSFSAKSYPEEGVLSSKDRLVVQKVRVLIGDRKELTRDYISSTSGYSSISEDGRTHTFLNPRGWPTKIVLDGVEYTSKDEPAVSDFTYVTFSGTQVSTTSGVLDIWYNHFRHSDSEILRIYNALQPPSPLTADQVTFDLSIICAAIEILYSELRLTSATSGVEVDIYEEIRINPKVGLDSRFKDLEFLVKQKDKLVDDILGDVAEGDIFGVLVD